MGIQCCCCKGWQSVSLADFLVIHVLNHAQPAGHMTARNAAPQDCKLSPLSCDFSNTFHEYNVHSLSTDCIGSNRML